MIHCTGVQCTLKTVQCTVYSIIIIFPNIGQYELFRKLYIIYQQI